MKKVTVISDLHCGHLVGLTPPSWQPWKDVESGARAKANRVQQEVWNHFSKIRNRRPDILIANGDLIDGKGQASGGCELFEPDMNEQASMAAEAIRAVSTKKTKIYIIRGTPYHVGKSENFEDHVAEILSKTHTVRIKDHLYLKIEGWLFDCKHKVGSSGIPHGRHTAPAKEKVWADLWAKEFADHPSSDVIIRSHVHYFGLCGNHNGIQITTPALQGLGSRYGEQQCSGVVNCGYLNFDVSKDKFPYPIPQILPFETQKPEVLEA